MYRGRGGWRGPGGSRRGGRGGSSPRPRQVCQHFLRKKCDYGTSCKYSHDSEDVSRLSEIQASTPSEIIQIKDDYFDFKRQIRQHRSSNFPTFTMVWMKYVETWTLAVKILDTPDRELHQCCARDLADEELGGLAFIQQTIEQCITLQADGCSLQLARVFLQAITHHSMLSSLSIDSFVGIIYRVLGGSNGGQGIPFFSDMSRRLSDHSQSPRSLLSLVVSSLHELFRRERKALLNDDLPDLLDALRHKAEQLANLTHDAETDPADLDGVSIRINMISKMMDGVRGVVSNDQSFGAMTAGNSGTVRSTFPLEVVIPGGNHDNDFADITKIQIFPTFGEVMSDAAEYLPTTDFSRPLFLRDPVQRYIDSAFRLLRHDIFGALKQVVGAILAQPHVADAASSNQFLTGNIKAHVYPRAGMQHILVDKNGGFETVVSFARPPQLRKLSLADQRRWWEDSSRLEPGGLVCFVSGSGDRKSFLLLVVTKKNTAEAKEGKNISTLISNRSNPAVTMRLASETSENMAMLNQIYVKKEEGLLIELPGLIPDTFVPILQNLQRMMRDGDLAFRQWIIPPTDHEGEQPVTEISPPAYTRRPGFKFRLQTITRSGYPALTVNPAVGDGDISAESLEAATGLDHGQATSLIAALTREYALIQGPPGTGKSYVGVQLVRVLLDHKVEAKLGPILIICYTNHALDQFLKHLMDVGIDKIIRIGGQSRAEELDGKNLRTVSQGMSKTKVEQRILGRSYSEAEGRFQDAGARLKSLHQARKGKPDWNMLKSFLFEQYPTIAKQFESLHQDNAGYKLVGNRDPVRLWLGNQQGQAARRDEVPAQNDAADLTLRAQQNINSLTTSERWTLVKSWIRQLTQLQSDRAFEFVKEAKGHRDEIQRVHDDVNRRTLLQADVVGITTTGLARNMNMLCRLGVKIVICEEAAEVIEPHLLSALMPDVEHFIQIGDHKQLRPQIENYLQFSMETATGRAYQLDRSQFERRAVGEPGLQALPVAQLNVQRRMRPEISQLIRRVYPDLEDHDCVKNLPSVVGMQNNLFWLDHDHPEDANDDGTRVKSHSNTWEVSMAKALIRHLVRQGEYKSTDIALLTPYTGQLRKLRASLSDDFEVFLSDRDLETLAKEGIEANPDQGQTVDIGTRKVVEKKKLLQTIRLATVDNFQGEEAKVIVVSLVRSNNNAKVGFLRTENRINVLLSRAQHGMYLIGNTKTYQNVPMWADVHQQLSSRKAVGTSIALCCPRHPDTPLLCSEPSDFTVKSPEGGCSQICDKRLEPCGHKCRAPCHSRRLHDAFDCLEPCPRLRTTCQHPCPKLCGQQCEPCKFKVDGVRLPCGHVHDKIPCHKTLDPESIKCSSAVEKYVPECGHSVTVPCYTDVSKGFSCPEKCVDMLKCGHPCPGTCGQCRRIGDQGTVVVQHQQCGKPCERPYGSCNHRCPKPCHDGKACGACSKKCEVRCPHSRCHQECQKPCAPCIEKCTWSCEHKGSCSLPCAAPCNRLPCDERCTKLLKCNHQCPTFCGEECPQDLCQECCTQKDAQVDFMEFKTYGEIDLNETPIAVLGCGHFFTGETLDRMVGMSSVYTTDNLEKYNGLQELSGQLTTIPACPNCRVPIRQFATRRYNRVINKAVLDETSKRFLVGGREKLAGLEERVTMTEKELADSRDSMILANMDLRSTFWDRHKTARRLEKETARLRKDMEAENQPTRKLFDAVMNFKRLQREQSLEKQLQCLSLSEPEITIPQQQAYDQQITLNAHRLQLRIQEAILRDVFTLLSKRNGPLNSAPILPGGHTLDKCSSRFLNQCKQLINNAEAAKLPRLVIQTILSYARVTQLDGWYHRTIAAATTAPNSNSQMADNVSTGDKTSNETAIELLDRALNLCITIPAPDGDSYRAEVEETIKLFAETRYEEVTPAEIAAIKAAMVSGPRGLATHSGHWYTCRNGHPFAIGECGMPMERALCPECGETIGGSNHTPVEGVERDERMERA